MTRFSAVAWPLATLFVALAFLAQDLLFAMLGAAPDFAQTAFRMTAWTIAVGSLVLLLLPGRRAAYLLGFLVCAGLMAWALYLQYGMDLEPCPLCVFQRIALIATGILFLVAAIQNPGPAGAMVYALLTFVTAGIGAALAAWQVWIQAQPKGSVPACGMGLDYMLDTMPLTEVIGRVLRGSGECAEKGWVLLGLAIPSWTFVFFVVMIAAALALARRE